MRIRSQAACIVAALIAAMGVAGPAYAASPSAVAVQAAGQFTITRSSLTSDEKAQLKANMTAVGIDAATQARLLKKIADGQPWDSMTGAAPVSTVTTTVDLRTSTRETFADGSVIVGVVSDTSGTGSGISPMSVSGCRDVSAGSYGYYHYDCVADVNFIYVQMGFTFDWSNIQYEGPRILAYRNGYHKLYLGSMSDLHFERQSDAAVRWVGTATLAGGWYSGTDWMQANASAAGSGAYTTHN